MSHAALQASLLLPRPLYFSAGGTLQPSTPASGNTKNGQETFCIEAAKNPASLDTQVQCTRSVYVAFVKLSLLAASPSAPSMHSL